MSFDDHYTAPPRRQACSVPNPRLHVLNEAADDLPRRTSVPRLEAREYPILHATREAALNASRSDDGQDSYHTAPDDDDLEDDGRISKMSFSSYQHPYDISPPARAYTGTRTNTPLRPTPTLPAIAPRRPTNAEDLEAGNADCELGEDDRRGVLHNILDLYTLDHHDAKLEPAPDDTSPLETRAMRRGGAAGRVGTIALGLAAMDADDPLVTGVVKKGENDDEEARRNVLKNMTYKQRRKEMRRLKIVNNIVCESSLYSCAMNLT